MDHIELTPMGFQVIQRICLVKFEWIMWLRININSNHFVPGLVVSHGCASSSAIQIEQPHTRPPRLFNSRHRAE